MEINTALLTEEATREALRSAEDHMVEMSIAELGLAHRIDVAPERIYVEMTMTPPTCPLVDLITDNAHQAVGAVLPQGVDVEIEPILFKLGIAACTKQILVAAQGAILTIGWLNFPFFSFSTLVFSGRASNENQSRR